MFPDHPGDEIIAIFAHRFSQRAIRVYDLAGTPLYEVWYNGCIAEAYWMADAGLLICAGDDADAYWEELGVEGQYMSYPLVLFALRPREGLHMTECMKKKPGGNNESLAWLKYLHPLEANDVFGFRDLQEPDLPEYGGGSFMALSLQAKRGRAAGVSWIIDRNGDEAPGTRFRTDAYKRFADTLPDYRIVEFLPTLPRPATSASPVAPRQNLDKTGNATE